MTTRVEIRARVRLELGDGGPSYVWSEALLNEYIGQGLTTLTAVLPPRRELSLAAVEGQREYPLAIEAGPGGVVKVQCPPGRRLPYGETEDYIEGSTARAYRQCWNWWEEAKELVFRYGLTAGETIVVRYAGQYGQPQSDGDGLDLAKQDEVLLVWLVCGRCVEWLAGQREKRTGQPQAVRVPNGQRVEAGYYESLYSSGLAERRRAKGVRTGILDCGF